MKGRKRFAVVLRLLDSPSRARAALGVLLAAGLLLFARSPAITRVLGLNELNFWFLDSYAVLAASDAFHAGLDVDQPIPLDILRRPHAYTDWWFALRWFGLTREDNFLVGVAWVLSFAVVAWLTVRPRNGPETLICAGALLSPPVLLAVNRANNDLVIFTLLGLGALALAAGKPWGRLLALLAIALATGLKIYPVVAAAVFLLLRPARTALVASAAAALVLLLVLHDIWPSFHRGILSMPPALYTFGAAVLVRDLGLAGRGPLLASGLVIVAGAIALIRARVTTGLADTAPDFERRVLFTLGAVLLVACFFAGISYEYRWIFAVWLVPWLLVQAERNAPPTTRRTARFTLGLLLAVLWLDAGCCAIINGLVGPTPLLQLEGWLLHWRLVTQPFTWLLIALLAGWLLEAAVATVHVWRPAKPVAA